MGEDELEGKVALVTGASRGIGRAVAIELARAGAKVYVNYLSSARAASEVLDEIKKLGGEAVESAFDVGDSAAVKSAMGDLLKSEGCIDIVVNNAGVTKDGLLMRMKDEDFNRVVAVNLGGAFLVTRAALRPMVKARWGRIINITSVVGQSGREGQANYAASKAALIGFTKSVAREVAGRNITCNAISPGFIETDLTARMDDKQREAVLDMIPLGRFGLPEEVARLARFLAGENAGYITGAVIPINGGLYM